MVNDSININKTNNHLLSQPTEHKKDHDIRHWKSLGQVQKCGEVKPVNVITSLPSW